MRQVGDGWGVNPVNIVIVLLDSRWIDEGIHRVGGQEKVYIGAYSLFFRFDPLAHGDT